MKLEMDDKGGVLGNGFIKRVRIMEAGIAKGHTDPRDSKLSEEKRRPLILTPENLDELASLINQSPNGIKAKFSHGSIFSDSIGTYLGRFYNAEVVDGICYADLHFSNVAKSAPNGTDYVSYLLGMAKDGGDTFGFSADINFNKNGQIINLNAIDAVDAPAATSALFSVPTHEKTILLNILSDITSSDKHALKAYLSANGIEIMKKDETKKEELAEEKPVEETKQEEKLAEEKPIEEPAPEVAPKVEEEKPVEEEKDDKKKTAEKDDKQGETAVAKLEALLAKQSEKIEQLEVKLASMAHSLNVGDAPVKLSSQEKAPEIAKTKQTPIERLRAQLTKKA